MTQSRSRKGRRSSTKSPAALTTIPNLCDAVVEAGLLIAVIIAPLYFNPRTQHTFEPDKAALLRSVLLIAFLAWLINKLGNLSSVSRQGNAGEKARQNPQKLTRQKQGTSPNPPIPSFPFSLFPFSPFPSPAPLVLPTLFLLTAYLAGTAVSVLPRVSLWGSYERRQGLYTLVAYIVLFFLVRATLSTPARRQRLIDAILLVSLPISVYAVVQHFGLDPLRFQTGGAGVTLRAISTLGNPIFLGAYLAMVVPLTGVCTYLVWRRRADGRPNLILVALYVALLILQLTALFFAQSRGPILGLIGGLGFGAFLWIARGWTRRAVVGIVAALVLVVAGIGLLPVAAPSIESLGRLTQLISPTSRTGRQRLLVWEGTVNLVTAEPARMWFGYGPETLRDIIGPYMPVEIAAQKPDEDFDRAHNAVLDLWASTGLLGVVAYMLVIGAVLYHGLRILKLITDARGRKWFLALAAGGTLLGGLASWLAVGRAWTGVGLALGLLGGVGVFVMWCGLSAGRHDRTENARSGRALSGDQLLVIALMAALVSHVIETLVGIGIVATNTLFWVYAALMAGLATRVGERRSTGAGANARPQHLVSSAVPPHVTHAGRSAFRPPSTVLGLITGIALGLFSFSLLGSGEARGGLAWGLIASVTLAFGVVHLSVDRSASSSSDPEFKYLVVSTGTVLCLWVFTWLPWPPLDITHTAVATYVYVVVVQLVLAACLAGVGGSAAAIPRLSWVQWTSGGLLAAIACIVIWFSNVTPVRADVLYKQGLGLSAAGDFQGAAQAAQQSVALSPREDRYHSAIGAAYAQMAQTTEERDLDEWRSSMSTAATHLLEAHRIDPYRADHLRNLGVLHRLWANAGPPAERTSHLRQALAYYEQATTRNPVGVRIWREWGETHAALGEWDAAVQRYEESLRLNDGFFETWLLLAQAKLRQADYFGARRAYSQALTLDEALVQRERRAAASSANDPLPHQALALIYAVLEQREAALAEAYAARRLMSTEPADWESFLQAVSSDR